MLHIKMRSMRRSHEARISKPYTVDTRGVFHVVAHTLSTRLSPEAKRHRWSEVVSGALLAAELVLGIANAIGQIPGKFLVPASGRRWLGRDGTADVRFGPR